MQDQGTPGRLRLGSGVWALKSGAIAAAACVPEVRVSRGREVTCAPTSSNHAGNISILLGIFSQGGNSC